MTDHDTPAPHGGSAGTCWSCLFHSHVSVTIDGASQAECQNELSDKFGTLTAAGETCPWIGDIGGRDARR